MNIFGVVHRISSLWRDLSEVRQGRSKIALMYGLTNIIWAALFNVGLYRSMINTMKWPFKADLYLKHIRISMIIGKGKP